MGDAGGRRILLTGIGGVLAGRLAARLEADERVEHIAGVDLAEPAQPLGRTEFIRADLRNPLVARVVDSARVDTIVHLSIATSPRAAGGRARMKELNVIGTMQLLAAAQRTPAVERVVVKSTTAVYGSSSADPALFREDAAGAGSHGPLRGYAKDAVEIERYARDFARRRPDAVVSLLRFANILGPRVDSPLISYLSLPVIPTVLGFDPRVQLCHEDDAVEVLYRSTMEDHPGAFNVAGPGILYLSQAIRMTGRPAAAVPQPLMGLIAGLLRRAGQVDVSPEQLQFLLFGRVGDISRMREHLGYEPRFSTRAALEDFLGSGRITPLVDAETAARLEGDLRRLLTRAGGSVTVGAERPHGARR